MGIKYIIFYILHNLRHKQGHKDIYFEINKSLEFKNIIKIYQRTFSGHCSMLLLELLVVVEGGGLAGGGAMLGHRHIACGNTITNFRSNFIAESCSCCSCRSCCWNVIPFTWSCFIWDFSLRFFPDFLSFSALRLLHLPAKFLQGRQGRSCSTHICQNDNNNDSNKDNNQENKYDKPTNFNWEGKWSNQTWDFLVKLKNNILKIFIRNLTFYYIKKNIS